MLCAGSSTFMQPEPLGRIRGGAEEGTETLEFFNCLISFLKFCSVINRKNLKPWMNQHFYQPHG